MNIEDLRKEASRREASLNKLGKEIKELRDSLVNISGEEKKGIESEIAAKEAKREAELGSIKHIYTSIYNHLHEEELVLTEKLRLFDKKSDEYANTLLERNAVKREADEAMKKVNEINSNSNKSKKIVEVEEGNEETKNTSCKAVRIIALAILGSTILVIGSCHIGKNCTKTNNNGEALEVVTTPEALPFDTYGCFTEIDNPLHLEERAKWYIDKYNLGNSITVEQLVDALCIFNGELPVDGKFENETLMLTNNRVVNAYIFVNSTFDDVKNGTRKFVPVAPMFLDNTYIQDCALELDAIMKPLVDAMNRHDNAAYEKYAKMFGVLIIDQYYLVSNSNGHKGVRGLVPSTEAINLYCFEYAQYTGNIVKYGIENNIDICIPICFNHQTGEIVNVPLANLMATIDMVPMNEWDAVLQRAGLTTEDIEKLGNGSVEDSMPVIMVRDAKEHFKEKKNELNSQKTLG